MSKILVTITDQETGHTMLISTNRDSLVVPTDNTIREPLLEAVGAHVTSAFGGSYSRSYDVSPPTITQMFRLGNHIID